MDPTATSMQFQQSETSLRVHVSWYTVICGHLRSMLSTTFKRHKPRPSSLVSISNPSIFSLKDSVEEVEELSPSEQFSWTRMADIFFEYKLIHNTQGEELSMETINIAQKIFDNLLVDEDKYAESLYDSMLKLDKSYAERFYTSSHLPKIRPREHMTRHLKKILELHRILLYAFSDDPKKAMQILNLLALSHVLMKITIYDFRLFQLALGKFFFRTEMVDETNVHQVIGYVSTVTLHIEKLLQRHCLENRKRELLLIDNADYLVDINSVCRENYRELKKWKQIQMIIRKSVGEREQEQMREGLSLARESMSMYGVSLVADALSVRTVSQTASYDSMEVEGWLIEFLKRGYKYRSKPKRDV